MQTIDLSQYGPQFAEMPVPDNARFDYETETDPNGWWWAVDDGPCGQGVEIEINDQSTHNAWLPVIANDARCWFLDQAEEYGDLCRSIRDSKTRDFTKAEVSEMDVFVDLKRSAERSADLWRDLWRECNK